MTVAIVFNLACSFLDTRWLLVENLVSRTIIVNVRHIAISIIVIVRLDCTSVRDDPLREFTNKCGWQ